jgi:cell division protein FtsW (lipid II flippase)
MKPPRTQPTLFFRLIVPATVIFILTILALIACLFGNPEAPVAQWLESNGNSLLIGEFLTVIALSVLAMYVDRVRTLRGIDELPALVPARDDSAVAEKLSDITDASEEDNNTP